MFATEWHILSTAVGRKESHERMETKYKTAVYDVRDHATAGLNERMVNTSPEGIPGAMQDRIAADRFVGLDVDINNDEVGEEPVYWGDRGINQI